MLVDHREQDIHNRISSTWPFKEVYVLLTQKYGASVEGLAVTYEDSRGIAWIEIIRQ